MHVRLFDPQDVSAFQPLSASHPISLLLCGCETVASRLAVPIRGASIEVRTRAELQPVVPALWQPAMDGLGDAEWWIDARARPGLEHVRAVRKLKRPARLTHEGRIWAAYWPEGQKAPEPLPTHVDLVEHLSALDLATSELAVPYARHIGELIAQNVQQVAVDFRERTARRTSLPAPVQLLGDRSQVMARESTPSRSLRDRATSAHARRSRVAQFTRAHRWVRDV